MTATPVFCSFAGRKTLSVGFVTFVTWRDPRLPVVVSSPMPGVSPGTLPGQRSTIGGSAAETGRPRHGKLRNMDNAIKCLIKALLLVRAAAQLAL